MSGKGDTYRPVDRERYDKNYERIFGHRPQCWHTTCRKIPASRLEKCIECGHVRPISGPEMDDATD